MGEIKMLNIKVWSYCFYNDTVNFDEFNGSNIKADRKSFNDIDIYHLGYERKKKITECNVINSVKPLYLRITGVKGQFKKGKDDNVWYLIIFGNENVLMIFANIWKRIRTKIEENTDGIVEDDKDYTRIKFKGNDNLATDKTVNIRLAPVIIRSVFAQNGKYYNQLFLDSALYELKKCCNIKKLMFQKELM